MIKGEKREYVWMEVESFCGSIFRVRVIEFESVTQL